MRTLAALFVLALSPVALNAEDDPATAAGPEAVEASLVEELKTVAAQDWRGAYDRLNSYEVGYTAEYKLTIDGVLDSEDLERNDVVYSKPRQLALVRSYHEEMPDGIVVQAANERYSFTVSTEDTAKRGTLHEVESRLEIDDDGPPPVAEDLPDFNRLRGDITRGFSLGGWPLWRLLNPDEFEILSCRERVADFGRSLVVEATPKIDDADAELSRSETYEIVLEPAVSYRIRSMKSDNTSPPLSVNWTLSYHESPNEVFPKTLRTTSRGPGAVAEWDCRFSEPQPFATDSAEFYLPHYGFSEEVLNQMTANPWPRWMLVLGGVASLLVGGLILRRRRE